MDRFVVLTLVIPNIILNRVPKEENMTIKKTAISIEKPLFEEMDALAKEMEVSRSYLFKLAASEFIQRYKNRKLLDAINAAYKDLPDSGEDKVREHMKTKQRRLVKDQW